MNEYNWTEYLHHKLCPPIDILLSFCIYQNSAAASGCQFEVSTKNTCRQAMSKSRRRHSIKSVPDHRLWFVTPSSEILGGDSSWAGSCNLQLTVQIVQCNEGFLAVHNSPSGLFHDDTPSFHIWRGRKATTDHQNINCKWVYLDIFIYRNVESMETQVPPPRPVCAVCTLSHGPSRRAVYCPGTALY